MNIKFRDTRDYFW